jgi:peptide/nickel transport system substrate-binding protein
MEAEAFDGYVWGRPKIDRLLIKLTIDNNNALVTYLLSGEIDMTPIGSLDPAHYDVLKRELEATGKGTVNGVLARVRQFQWQFRDPTLPWAADVRVRQAMLEAIDRQAIADSVYFGLTSVAHTVVLPTERLYGLLEQRGLKKYPFDRRDAEQLLDAAGWPRAADGIRRNAAGTVLSHTPSTVQSKDQELLAMVGDLNAVGIRTTPDIFPTGVSDELEHRSKADSNGRNAQWDSSGVYWDRFVSAQIAVPPRWSGANNGGYVNPVVDSLFEKWLTAVVPDERTEIEIQFHKLLVDELAYLPLVYDFEIFAYRKGLVGPKPFGFEGGNTTWDIHSWTLD